MPLVNNSRKLQVSEKIANVLLDKSQKWRYRVLAGGRCGGKDYAISSIIIERAVTEPIRVLFTREIQNSIKESIHRLLCDQIARMGYSAYFDCLETEIRGKNGSLFMFKGIRHNVKEFKSTEGVDLCVLCEAQETVKESFDEILDPTIRSTPGKPEPEIWIIFNPHFDDDFVYDRFVLNKPDNAITGIVNYLDNPWCPPDQIALAERMKQTDPELYKCVWLGEPRGQGGRVFPQYNADVHEIDFDIESLAKCDLYMAIDPHRKYYPFCTWFAVTPTDAVVIYNEWPRYDDLQMHYDEARLQRYFDLTPQQLANTILANDMTLRGGRIMARVGDPRFLKENPDLLVQLQQQGVFGWVEAPFERIETQREGIRQMLSYNPALPLGGINMPDLYVSKRCRNVSRALKRHSWSLDDKDKESEDYKDPIDTIRYFRSIFPDGTPKFQRRDAAYSTPLKSLATAQLEKLPSAQYAKKA